MGVGGAFMTVLQIKSQPFNMRIDSITEFFPPWDTCLSDSEQNSGSSLRLHVCLKSFTFSDSQYLKQCRMPKSH